MSSLSRPSALAQYGLLGWALGAVAVPIYIQVPFLYARVLEVPAAWIGVILLLSRLLDALLDPLIGLWVDTRHAQGNRYQMPLLTSVPLLLLGMYGVFYPLGNDPFEYALSLMASLIVVHLGYSLASIAYQAWGAELGETDQDRARFVAVREGIGILGVVFAVSLSLETHAGTIYTGFAVMLLLGITLLLRHAPRAPGRSDAHAPRALRVRTGFQWKALLDPLRRRNFRRLATVFLFNGLAAALPATLVPFYMRDRLGLGDGDQWVLAVYFLVGAASTVFWVWLAGQLGLVRAWLLGMVLSIPAFVLVVLLPQGALLGYLGVCVLTGFALGADLALPAALLARLIRENGQSAQAEGTYFGLWNWVNKLNLALAPTLALGALQGFGYSAQHLKSAEFQALSWLGQMAQDPLIWVYALLPCAIKLLAIVCLACSGLGKAPSSSRSSV